MLVLSRQRDETIVFDFSKLSDADFEALRHTPIEMAVVDIRGDKVRIGTDAMKCVEVHRKEVYDAIRRENLAAAQVKPDDLPGIGRPAPTAEPIKS